MNIIPILSAVLVFIIVSVILFFTFKEPPAPIVPPPENPPTPAPAVYALPPQQHFPQIRDMPVYRDKM